MSDVEQNAYSYMYQPIKDKATDWDAEKLIG